MAPISQQVIHILQKEGLLTRPRLDSLKQFEQSASGNVVDFLLQEERSLDRPIDRYLRELHRLPVVCLDDVELDAVVAKRLPRAVCSEHFVLPFHVEDQTLYVAMANPDDLEVISFIERQTQLHVVPYLADRGGILRAITKLFEANADDHHQVITDLITTAKALGTDAETMAKETPIIQLLDRLMIHALRSSASDLHLEPGQHDVVVRLRIDGLLHDAFRLPTQLHAPLIARIKILGQMRIDEHLRPQDARFTFADGERSVAVRVSIVPALYGQKAVLRFLETDTARLSLDGLGLRADVRRPIDASLKHPHGLLLVTGPTGSGKTTTLYAMINALRKQHVNISTIEDPVEYHIPDVTQIQVNPNVGLTFATGLRSILRQDPDIILVGEIRDRETADIAINAALTGHLVLSSLHTNTAAGAITRLLDIGVEPYLISSTLRGVINQRLVRTVCPHCGQQAPVTEWPAQLQAVQPIAPSNLMTGIGCAKCYQTGYAGRTGIFEVLTVTDPIHQLIMRRANAQEIAREARQQGMPTLLEDAMTKVLTQQTTPQEVVRVVE